MQRTALRAAADAERWVHAANPCPHIVPTPDPMAAAAAGAAGEAAKGLAVPLYQDAL